MRFLLLSGLLSGCTAAGPNVGDSEADAPVPDSDSDAEVTAPSDPPADESGDSASNIDDTDSASDIDDTDSGLGDSGPAEDSGAPVDTGPFGDPWPEGADVASPGLSLVADGRVLGPGSRFVLRTGPAGRDAETTTSFTLTNRSDSTRVFSDASSAWLVGEGFAWEELPPVSLAPDASARFSLVANGATASEATRFEAELRVPGTEIAVELVAEVPRPLRMVLVGDGGFVAASDDYGASFGVVRAASGVPNPTRVRSLEWGEGVFFRSQSENQDWSTNGQYDTSIDAITWTPSGVAPEFWSSDCTYGIGQFVCARSGVLSSSADGRLVIHEPMDWRPLINALASDGERVVGVGRVGRRVVSTDGKTWAHDTTSSLAPTPEFNAITYGNGKFIAVGGWDRFVVATSADGVTWSEQQWGDSQWAHLHSVAWNGTLFLACGSNNAERLIWRSSDGLTWENVPEPGRWDSYQLLGAYDGYFYGVSARWGQEHRVFRSLDGSEWAEVLTAPVGQRIRALAMEGLDRSDPTEGSDADPDGPSIEDPSFEEPSFEPDTDIDPACPGLEFRVEGDGLASGSAIGFGTSPARGAPRRVTVEVHNPCAASVRFLGHPAEWVYGDRFSVEEYPPVSLRPEETASFVLRFDPAESADHEGALVLPHDGPHAPFLADLRATSGPPLRLVAVGDGGYRWATTDYGASTAFEEWTTLIGHTRDLIRGVCWGGGRFVGVGGNAESVSWVSTDGVTWSDHESPGSWLADCAYGNGMFVAAGYWPFTSVDGTVWVQGSTFPPQHTRSVTFGDGVFIGAGDRGQVLTTTAGAVWESQQTVGDDGFRSSVFGGGIFVVAGDNGTVAASDDGGLTWFQQNITGAGMFLGLAYAGDRFYLGDGASIYVSDDGIGWDRVNASSVMPRQGVGSTLFGWGSGALHRSDDGGFSWERLTAATGGLGVLDMAVEGE
jgi:hypothetical protein